MRNRILLLVWIVTGSLNLLSLKAQFSQGTEFWMGFMEHVDRDRNTKVLMITSEYATQGRVIIPLKGWSHDFEVLPNQVTRIELPMFSETLGSERKDSTGIYIRSRDPIAVYAHQYANARSEASLVLPTTSLGRDYYVMSYRGYEERQTTYPSQFLIVATQNGTEVEMHFSDQTRRGVAAGGSGRVTLQKGQTFQVQGALPTSDLTGTYLRSNKPIALFGGAVWTQVPSGCLAPDNLYEQMYPIQYWGREVIAIPSKDVDYDLIRVLACMDGTTLKVDNQFVATLDAGKFYERRISGKAVYFSADRPILVAQFNPSHECNSKADLLQGDPSMVLLNHLYQTSRVVTFYASSFDKISMNYLSVLSRTSDAPSILLDSMPLEGFRPVPANPDYSYLTLEISNGAHQLTSGGCGLAAYSYGFGRLESYAYATGAGFHLVNETDNPIPPGACLEDSIVFDHGIDPEFAQTWWTLGDGTTSREAKVEHCYANTGVYPVQLVLHNLCIGTYDTLRRNLTVVPPIQIEAEPESILACAGDPVQFTTNELEGTQYLWTGPGSFHSDTPSPTFKVKDSTWTGSYVVTASVPGCSSLPDTVYMEVRDPKPELGPDTTLCLGDTFFLPLPPGNFSAFRWKGGHQDSLLRVFMPDVYWLETRDSLGCRGRDSMTVFDRCPPPFMIPTSFSPNGDGRNDAFRGFFPELTEFNLLVFSLSGEQVFATTNPEEGWDGTNQGEEMPEGIYRWKLFLAEPDPANPEVQFQYRVSGQVTLVRWGMGE